MKRLKFKRPSDHWQNRPNRIGFFMRFYFLRNNSDELSSDNKNILGFERARINIFLFCYTKAAYAFVMVPTW